MGRARMVAGAGGEVEGRLAAGVSWRSSWCSPRTGSAGSREQITVDFFGPGHGSTTLRRARHRSAPRRKSDVDGGAVLRRDQVCRAVLTWKPGGTLPTCHATVYGYFWKNL